MSLKILSKDELERHHEQARQAIADAEPGDTKVLHAAMTLAHRVEREKARRNSERGAAQ